MTQTNQTRSPWKRLTLIAKLHQWQADDHELHPSKSLNIPRTVLCTVWLGWKSAADKNRMWQCMNQRAQNTVTLCNDRILVTHVIKGIPNLPKMTFRIKGGTRRKIWEEKVRGEWEDAKNRRLSPKGKSQDSSYSSKDFRDQCQHQTSSASVFVNTSKTLQHTECSSMSSLK